MKKFYLFFGLFVLISCNNNHKKNDMVDSAATILESVETPLPAIDPLIREGILDLVDSSSISNLYEEINMEESCLLLYTLVDPKNKGIYFSDSTINVTYNRKGFNEKGYKGVLTIDGYKIAIFDSYGFNDNFYNKDSLEQISYDNFKKYVLSLSFAMCYYLRDGKLNYWNP